MSVVIVIHILLDIGKTDMGTFLGNLPPKTMDAEVD